MYHVCTATCRRLLLKFKALPKVCLRPIFAPQEICTIFTRKTRGSVATAYDINFGFNRWPCSCTLAQSIHLDNNKACYKRTRVQINVDPKWTWQVKMRSGFAYNVRPCINSQVLCRLWKHQLVVLYFGVWGQPRGSKRIKWRCQHPYYWHFNLKIF